MTTTSRRADHERTGADDHPGPGDDDRADRSRLRRRPPRRPQLDDRRRELTPSTLPAGDPAVPSTSSGDSLFPELGSADLDVQSYDVRLGYDLATETIDGAVTVTTLVRRPLDAIALDAAELVVDAVRVDGAPATFEQAGTELIVHPATTVTPAAPVVIDVEYHDERARVGPRLRPRQRLVPRRRRLLRAQRARRCPPLAAEQRPPVGQGDVALRGHGARRCDRGRQRRARRAATGRGRRRRGSGSSASRWRRTSCSC